MIEMFAHTNAIAEIMYVIDDMIDSDILDFIESRFEYFLDDDSMHLIMIENHDDYVLFRDSVNEIIDRFNELIDDTNRENCRQLIDAINVIMTIN